MEVGLAILGPLRELDEVAYLRFASVYRSFDTLDDFEAEIALLRAEGEPVGQEPHPAGTAGISQHHHHDFPHPVTAREEERHDA